MRPDAPNQSAITLHSTQMFLRRGSFLFLALRRLIAFLTLNERHIDEVSLQMSSTPAASMCVCVCGGVSDVNDAQCVEQRCDMKTSKCSVSHSQFLYEKHV